MKKVKLDILGRVCIPKDMRDKLNWDVNSDAYVYTTEDKVVITKQAPINQCPVCNKTFSSEYQFCPYCGQYLKNISEEKSNE